MSSARRSPAAQPETRPSTSQPHAREMAGMHNVLQFGPGLFSGSAPDGDAGFESLRKLGIRTIISVDGALPDVERAHRSGMRYVHLPAGHADALPAPEVFRDSLNRGVMEARALSVLLVRQQASAAELDAHFEGVHTSCKECHARFRDPPKNERLHPATRPS